MHQTVSPTSLIIEASACYMREILNHIQFDSQSLNGIEQCRRLFHGRGHAYPGYEHINVDWLPPVALITLYKEEAQENLESLSEALYQQLPECYSVQVQYRCRHRATIELLRGEMVEELVVEEGGLKFSLRLGAAQNSGLFLDMANGRQWVREHARGKRVLNLFSYTCAFSVAAIAGGARRVVNIDMSKAALNRGRENHRLNGQDLERVVFQGIDIFKSFSRIRRHSPYELVICDPPSLQKGSVDIKRDYKKIVRRIPEIVPPGGQLMLCLNSPTLDEQFLLDTVEQECPDCRYIERLSNPEVFREAMPGRGLKVMIFDYLP